MKRQDEKIDPIRYLVEQRLKSRTMNESSPATTAHLDEDVISAFVEARIDEAESQPIIAHLVECAACRHTTAQLIRLESEFDAEVADEIPNDDPGRVRQLFDRLAAGLTPSSEAEVFGYQSPEDEPAQEPADQTAADKSKD